MLTPKEALIKDGTIPVKEGRGRLSREAIERCKWLVANKGWSIKGYEVSSSTPATVKATEPVVNKVKVSNTKEVPSYTIYWPEASYKAVGVDGKVWGMANACNTCMVSLVQCLCGHPTIFGDIPVKIVAK